MTRRDYVALAHALFAAEVDMAGRVRPATSINVSEARSVAAEKVAEVLAADNPRFDRTAFLSAAAGAIR